MRTFLLLVCCVISAIVAHAQSTQTIICETPANDAFANVCIEMPEYREIWSGTKIIVTYDESVPQEMVGAFDYAAKLWEEQMPVTIPITIKVKVESIGGSRSSLSNVNMGARQFLSTFSLGFMPWTFCSAVWIIDFYNLFPSGSRIIADRHAFEC